MSFDHSQKLLKKKNSHYHKFLKFTGHVITIEGIVGAGKSTFGKSLEKLFNSAGLRAKFFPEYKNIPLLDQYITDMKKYAYSFQLVMLMKRIETYRIAHEFASQGGISIIDRSLVGDITFARMQVAKGNISPQEFLIYENVIRSEEIFEPDITVYLEASTDTVLKRIKERGIESEINGYSREYLDTLKENYEIVLSGIDNVVHIDYNSNIELQTSADEKSVPEQVVISILEKI